MKGEQLARNAKAREAKLNLIEIKKRRPKLTLGAAIDNYFATNSATT